MHYLNLVSPQREWFGDLILGFLIISNHLICVNEGREFHVVVVDVAGCSLTPQYAVSYHYTTTYIRLKNKRRKNLVPLFHPPSSSPPPPEFST